MIVCIEGADRTGKSTVVKYLAPALRNAGNTCTAFELPTKGIIREIIYCMLRSGSARRWPITFQLLQFLNRLLFQLFTLPFLRDEIVVIGRWHLSGRIYGSIEGVPRWILALMTKLMVVPDYTFILRGTVGSRDENDSYELNEMQRKVRNRYVMHGRIEPNCYTIKNTNDPHDAIRTICEILGSNVDE